MTKFFNVNSIPNEVFIDNVLLLKGVMFDKSKIKLITKEKDSITIFYKNRVYYFGYDSDIDLYDDYNRIVKEITDEN